MPMVRFTFSLLVMCFSLSVFAEPSGTSQITVELGAGQVKVVTQGIELPKKVIEQLQNELMVDSRLSDLVTAKEIKKINLDSVAINELVSQWEDHYSDTAEQIHELVVLQTTGELPEKSPEDLANDSDAELDEAVHRVLTPMLHLKSIFEERLSQWGADGVIDQWFSGWAIVVFALFGWLFSWIVMAIAESLLPGFTNEAGVLWRLNPAMNFGLGLLGSLAFLPGLVFLVVTLIGIILVPFYFAAAVFFMVLAYPVAVTMVGSRISKKPELAWTVAAGQAVFLVLSFIPFAGAVVKGCLTLMALGLSLRLIYRRIF